MQLITLFTLSLATLATSLPAAPEHFETKHLEARSKPAGKFWDKNGVQGTLYRTGGCVEQYYDHTGTHIHGVKVDIDPAFRCSFWT
jgi:hypothetical protein